MSPSFSTLPINEGFGSQITLLDWLSAKLTGFLRAQDDRLDARLSATADAVQNPFTAAVFVSVQKAD